MSYRIEIEGIGPVDMGKDESEAFARLLVTKSTDSGSAQKSAETLGGLTYAEMLTVIPGESVVSVFEKPEGKTEEKIRAKYTVKALIARVKAAATQAERQGEIFEYSEKATPVKESTEVKAIGSWLSKATQPESE